MSLYLSSFQNIRTLADRMRIKQLKEKIGKEETQLLKMMHDTELIWEDTGLDPKDSSYLIEKTMRFELAQKNIANIFSGFKELVKNYKSLCEELERAEE